MSKYGNIDIYGVLSRTNDSTIKSWEMYGGDLQIIVLDEDFEPTKLSDEHEKIFLDAYVCCDVQI